MNIRVIPFFLCFMLLLSGKGLSQNQAESNNEWKMVWQDEFNGKRINTSKWNILIRETSKHNELQYYVPDEVYIENGLLRIRSRVRKYGSREYTSGRLDTEGKFAPTYGRFEIRARLPKGQGLWPAHWLYPQNRDWLMEKTMEDAVANGKERLIPEERPWYTEIDIMEFLGHEPNILYGTLHYCSFDGSRKSSSGKWTDTVDYSEDFHIYALEWEPDSIRWYIDEHLLHSTTDGIPHTPHYLILNTAIGGSWPGNPDSTTTFPSTTTLIMSGYFKRNLKREADQTARVQVRCRQCLARLPAHQMSCWQNCASLLSV